MKELKDVDIKGLKEVVKELNDSGLIEKKIKLVGIKNADLLEAFVGALGGLDDDADVPKGVADFYNDLYADEIAAEAGTEDIDEDSEVEDVESDDDDSEVEVEDVESDDPESDDPESDDAEPVSVTPPKKGRKPPVVREKPAPKKKSLSVSRDEKRASINPKLSLIKKVANILNFKDQRYKQTTYFPLDVENIRILETNVGLYPQEILDMMKSDKKVWKKVEKFTPEILIREINKIKSAYAYIVGAIGEDKIESKFRNVMTTLVAGKEVPAEVAHYSTVKVARRALLAYMEVTGVDYSVMKDVRKELVKKAATKKETPAQAPKAKVKETPAPKTKSKKSNK